MTATATREEPAVAAPSGRAKSPKAGKQNAKKKSFLKSRKGIVTIVALLAVGGGGYMTLAPAKAGPPKGGDVVAMDPTTVNLTQGHYLKIAVAVQLVEGKASADAFRPSQAAELVIDEFSDRSVASLSSTEARKKLAGDLEHKIKQAYEGEVYAIFLTQFVTQ